MERSAFRWNGLDIPVIESASIVVGSGAAGFSAACRLHELGVGVAVVTECVFSGTSRNAGSDKQTYYKLSLCGDAPDSVQDMAETLFAGGSMDGDIALVEAALSARNFLRLADLGVPFPHNEFGEYAGYKTDHDPRQRATSAGPLTSRFMTEALEADARRRGIPVLDGLLVIGILTEQEPATCLGLLALDLNRLDGPARGLTLIKTSNIVWATGGAAGMFRSSVYPISQHGALGAALEAGAAAANLQEWQHGLASVGFRWNVSGTYQQVLPRYVSTDAVGGDVHEFLLDHWSPAEALGMVFLKGYQWPFDARKVPGSSLVDVYVAMEIERGRRVWLDYRANPVGLEHGFEDLPQECYEYLDKSGALFGTPFERLMKMNPDAVALYRSHGIDLESEMLEVAVCAQHMNGGLLVDRWWRTTVEGLYACGEAAGTFGAYRPGGSALNSTQTGALRAAQHIAANRKNAQPSKEQFSQAAQAMLDRKGKDALGAKLQGEDTVSSLLERARGRMSRSGAHLRSAADLNAALAECRHDIETYWSGISLSSASLLPAAFRGWDMLISQFACLSAMKAYVERGGPSRGSALILKESGQALPGVPWPLRPYGSDMDGFVLETRLTEAETPHCASALRPVHPIPERNLWFETVWAEFRAGEVYKK